jgi:hypothetical protein
MTVNMIESENVSGMYFSNAATTLAENPRLCPPVEEEVFCAILVPRKLQWIIKAVNNRPRGFYHLGCRPSRDSQVPTFRVGNSGVIRMLKQQHMNRVS